VSCRPQKASTSALLKVSLENSQFFIIVSQTQRQKLSVHFIVEFSLWRMYENVLSLVHHRLEGRGAVSKMYPTQTK
jgi:hypothetical protein